ncbi:ribonuclease P protein component [Pseudonocardia benzenivorans]|uniref:Ribonuclease P protein component n=2 Tax=Pseudonocardia TaxID=1847 RepID=F4CXX3_PSEUX|nr:ribonuclease P protein component [Pseudonocardia dioxanivorans]AEA28779.1 Ribonuclease P protein component [Pseudonocardia dioxanivorans CB1190]GJF01637.1 ribonuclease P protein component [Pseudonocardia sp. D17]
MLPAGARLTRRDEFTTTMRHGRRSGRSRLVVHLDVSGSDAPRAGFVVSKAVGNAVVRHRVSRRLRHVVAPRLGALPAGARLVVRALPASATASSAELAADLDGALRTAVRRLAEPAARR